MDIENLKSKILYEKELKILSKHLPEDLSNVVFNIATGECDYFSRFTIFRMEKRNRCNYWMYVGSYSNKIVLMNIIFSYEQRYITSNTMFIVDITPELYKNRKLSFKKYTKAIVDTLHMSIYNLEFTRTNLTFDDFLSKENFVKYILR